MPFEKAIRLFKRKVTASGMIQEVRERQQYIKPSQRRKEKLNYAKRRQSKRNNELKLQAELQCKSFTPEERNHFMKQHRKIK
jgi:ribosomal protein S21